MAGCRPKINAVAYTSVVACVTRTEQRSPTRARAPAVIRYAVGAVSALQFSLGRMLPHRNMASRRPAVVL
ncbi:hypothetical protein FA95DRAFT_1552678, partial [Auriscalpium vulgare]